MKLNGATAKRMRMASGRSQADFWRIVGVTQSGGSRYESGRKLPKPLEMLIVIAFGKERDAARVATKLRMAA